MGKFLPSVECGGINRGNIPRGAAPQDLPEVDPDTRGGIDHTLEQMSESINNTIQTELPRSGPPWDALTYTAPYRHSPHGGPRPIRLRIDTRPAGAAAKRNQSGAAQQYRT